MEKKPTHTFTQGEKRYNDYEHETENTEVIDEITTPVYQSHTKTQTKKALPVHYTVCAFFKNLNRITNFYRAYKK